MKYRKTFYFKNGSTFNAHIDYDFPLDELEKYYTKRLRKGKTIIEREPNAINIIDLKQVQIIKIKEIGDKDE